MWSYQKLTGWIIGYFQGLYKEFPMNNILCGALTEENYLELSNVLLQLTLYALKKTFFFDS